MNNRNIILLITLIVVAVGAYFLFMKDKEPAPQAEKVTTENKIEYYEDGKPIVYCDENGNRYNTVAEAKTAGLTGAEYGATYCPEYVAAKTGDYRGLTVVQAKEIAAARSELFRVVEIDGETQPTTRDFQEGRINATVQGGIVTGYFTESMNPPAQENAITAPGTHDAIIGMTMAEAEAYTKTNDINFRTGTIDGVGMALTMDFRPGRITAEVKNGVVVGYTVE